MKSNTQYTYDPLTTRLTNITTYSVVNGNLQNKSYEYSPAGDIVSIENNITGISYFYDYDGLHRLISETTNAGSATSAEILDYSYELAQIHAVSKINRNGVNYNFAYDDNGNNTSGYHLTNSPVTRTIKYNADNMPTQVRMSGSIAATFTYDAEGARVKKVAGSNTTYYYGDHYELENGTAVNYIFAGSLRIAKKQGSTVSFFHKDHLGSSTVVVSDTGAWQGKTEYMPYGTVRNESGSMGSDYMFTDQERDPEIGLYNYGARLYDPIMGVFVSADTIVQSPGDPQTYNRYSYCRNNPLTYTDPSGQSFVDFLGTIVGVGFAMVGMPIPGAMLGSAINTAASGGGPGDFAIGMVVGSFAGFSGGGFAGSIATATGMNPAGIGTALLRGGLSGAIGGAGSAAIYGGDIGKGALYGAIGGMATSSVVWGYRSYLTEKFINNNVHFSDKHTAKQIANMKQAMREAGQSPSGQRAMSAFRKTGSILNIIPVQEPYFGPGITPSCSNTLEWNGDYQNSYVKNSNIANASYGPSFDDATLFVHELAHSLAMDCEIDVFSIDKTENCYRSWMGKPLRPEYGTEGNNAIIPRTFGERIMQPW